MKILGSTKSKITKSKNGEFVPNLEFTEVILVTCNIVNNNYRQNSRVLYTFFANKLFHQVLDISPKTFLFLKLLTQNFWNMVEVWFILYWSMVYWSKF